MLRGPQLIVGEGRIRSKPLAARRGGRRRHDVWIGTIALNFVETPDRVVAVRDEEHVVRDPAVIEAVGPHAGHAAPRHLHHVVLGEHPPLVDRDGIDRLVVRARAGRRIQIGLRFVQVVQDRRLPIEVDALDGPREREKLTHPVAVVVVLHVLAPVHERQPRGAFGLFLVEIVGIDHLLAAVHLDDRRDQRDDVGADVLDEGRVFHREPVRHLHQHLWTAGLRRVHAAREVVDRLGRANELLRLLLGGLPRVRELREHGLVLVDRLDRGFVGDRGHDHVAPFLGLSDVPDGHAIRRLVERGKVAMDVGGMGEDAGRPGHVAEKFERRGYRIGGRQVIDELGRNPRVREVFLDLGGVLAVRLLSGGGGLSRLRVEARAGGGKRDGTRERGHEARTAVHVTGSLEDGRRGFITRGGSEIGGRRSEIGMEAGSWELGAEVDPKAVATNA